MRALIVRLGINDEAVAKHHEDMDKELDRAETNRVTDLAKAEQAQGLGSGCLSHHTFHAQYDWTTGVPDNGNEWGKLRAVPRLYPLSEKRLIRLTF